jgi:hypothetical protein
MKAAELLGKGCGAFVPEGDADSPTLLDSILGQLEEE